MFRFVPAAGALVLLLILPSLAHAQASVSGVVRDTSGAVLPGVTVEAMSPALIEGVRSTITDGSGRYVIEQLRPGDYVVIFTLPGFATVSGMAEQVRLGHVFHEIDGGLRQFGVHLERPRPFRAAELVGGGNDQLFGLR